MQAGFRGTINSALKFCARQADAGDFMKDHKEQRLYTLTQVGAAPRRLGEEKPTEPFQPTTVSSNCRQTDIDYTTDHQKLVLALQNAGQQAAVEEYLGQRHFDREDVVAELAGALATAGE